MGQKQLWGVFGDTPLASLDNDQAKQLVASWKASKDGKGKARFSDKTIGEMFKVFTSVIASAQEKSNPLFAGTWNLAYIGVPLVDKSAQHRPTLTRTELERLLDQVLYSTVLALLAGSGLRISEMLALEIGKHVSADCNSLWTHVFSRRASCRRQTQALEVVSVMAIYQQ